jgi:hypothetical protein
LEIKKHIKTTQQKDFVAEALAGDL